MLPAAVSVSVWFPVCKHDIKDDSEMYHTDTDTLPYRHRHSTIQTQTLKHDAKDDSEMLRGRPCADDSEMLRGRPCAIPFTFTDYS